MTDKQIKEELKQVVTNLGNIEFTVEDELNFCKEVLKRKEQECEKWKSNFNDKVSVIEGLLKQLDQLKALKEQAEQKLEKIKPILEYYANSYIGKKQLDGKYKYDLGNENCIFYDPCKAKEGLKIIDEVE